MLCEITDGGDACMHFQTIPSEDEAPGYRDVVSQPISLSDIDGKIQTFKYSSWIKLTSDLKRMLSNAKKYNEAHSKVYEDAVILEKEVKNQIRKFQVSDAGYGTSKAIAFSKTITWNLRGAKETYSGSHRRKCSNVLIVTIKWMIQSMLNLRNKTLCGTVKIVSGTKIFVICCLAVKYMCFGQRTMLGIKPTSIAFMQTLMGTAFCITKIATGSS